MDQAHEHEEVFEKLRHIAFLFKTTTFQCLFFLTMSKQVALYFAIVTVWCAMIDLFDDSSKLRNSVFNLCAEFMLQLWSLFEIQLKA